MLNFTQAATMGIETRKKKQKKNDSNSAAHSQFSSFFWPQKTGTSVHNKRPLIFFYRDFLTSSDVL